jgi:hypothetical protein
MHPYPVLPALWVAQTASLAALAPHNKKRAPRLTRTNKHGNVCGVHMHHACLPNAAAADSSVGGANSVTSSIGATQQHNKDTQVHAYQQTGRCMHMHAYPVQRLLTVLLVMQTASPAASGPHNRNTQVHTYQQARHVCDVHTTTRHEPPRFKQTNEHGNVPRSQWAHAACMLT